MTHLQGLTHAQDHKKNTTRCICCTFHPRIREYAIHTATPLRISQMFSPFYKWACWATVLLLPAPPCLASIVPEKSDWFHQKLWCLQYFYVLCFLPSSQSQDHFPLRKGSYGVPQLHSRIVTLSGDDSFPGAVAMGFPQIFQFLNFYCG